MDHNKAALAWMFMHHTDSYSIILFSVVASVSQILLFFLSFDLSSWSLFLCHAL